MFNFIDMILNREQRVVARYEKDNLIVDTCLVTDSDQPYETGIRHPDYNEGLWIIVEMYETKEDAQKGHDKWVALMTAKLPEKLYDVGTSEIAQLRDIFAPDDEEPRVFTKAHKEEE